MGVEQVASTIRKLMANNEALETAQNCEAAHDILSAAVKKGHPEEKVEHLVYKAPGTDTILHHALRVTDMSGQRLLVNPIQTALFPQYIGPEGQAPSPFFALMEKVGS